MSRKIGILGFGYLGNELAKISGVHTKVWVTRQHASDVEERPVYRPSEIVFRWNDPDTWSNLPDDDSILIITIPPVLEDVSAEKERLQDWSNWIQNQRKQLRRCIYISSTGVYPNLAGIWTEQSQFDCDNLKGALRHTTEKILADQFTTKVIRPGAIYGNQRNIGRRILARKPVPKGEQPVHRIHVHDLARIILHAVDDAQFPDLVNAVDLKSETTRNVASWLVNQPFFPKTDESLIEFRSDFQTRKFNLTQPDRKICNARLVKDIGFSFVFPTYKEGLEQAFANHSSHQQ